MRVARDRLIFLALCALDEIVDQAEEGPIEPSFALRFILAFLYALSDGKERGCYDGFWRCVTPKTLDPWTQTHDAYHAYAQSHLRGIAKSLGIDFEHGMREPIDRARGKDLTDDRLKAKAFRDSAVELERRKEWGRRARFCDLERVEPFPKERK